ncbi:hypothetical protein BC826DRAFT_1036839 [Russula brevipes]|nr:hypothetical protein BC826DRAFT_1036839 [Russula brevipes]
MATLLPGHPLHKPRMPKTTLRIKPLKRHRSPIHHLRSSNLDPTTSEKIRTTARKPAHTGKLPLTAMGATRNSMKEVQIYMDGLAMEAKVGAAATASTRHTAHEAELVGILLGIQLAKSERRVRTTFAIGVDNQAAIKAEALQIVNRIQQRRGRLKGNELAGQEAKKKTRTGPTVGQFPSLAYFKDDLC